MKAYLRFLSIGLVLGLFTEFIFRIVATSNPKAFVSAVFFYPLILTFAFAAHKLVNRVVVSQWGGDITHYLLCGICGLGVEWIFLGNGPGSNAFQLGMFAMWTTFCFGPRILTRDDSPIDKSRRKFWKAFGFTAILCFVIIMLIKKPDARFVVAVLGLSVTNIVWSAWLLLMARRTSQLPQSTATMV